MTPNMTTGAWIYMFSVWAVILALNVFCIVRMFKKRTPNAPEDDNDH